MKHTIAAIFNDKRMGIFITLALSCTMSISLVVLRVAYTDTQWFMFLLWNLFLAWVPLAISTWLRLRLKIVQSRMVLFTAIATWLLFFPNAPYIITDVLHLKDRTDAPFWFDLTILVSFAWNGLIMGLISLMDVQEVISRKYSHKTGWIASFLFVVLGSFGVYLGRYERWNSWDIITNPIPLLYGIADVFVHPSNHPKTIAITALFSVFLFIAYVMLHQFGSMVQHKQLHIGVTE